MGLFDFFKRNKSEIPDDEPSDRKLASLSKTASNKRAQGYDRDEAIRGLIEYGTTGAVQALLKRFNLKVDPSITDQEEKQLAFDGIVMIGNGTRGKRVSDEGKDPKEISDEPLTKEEKAEIRDKCIEYTRAYCDRAESLTWGLKVMRALLDDESYEKELLELLSNYDTEYTRNVEPKLNILAAMEEVHTDAVRLAVEEYLDDVNETVRFHAVQTVFEIGDEASIPPLVALVKAEESVRIKNKVAEGLIASGWKVTGELFEDFREAMKDAYEYRVDDDGSLRKA